MIATPTQAKEMKRKYHRHEWTVNFRDARGETLGISSSDVKGLLDEALRFNAVAITLFRGKRCGPNVTLSQVQGIFRQGGKGK